MRNSPDRKPTIWSSRPATGSRGPGPARGRTPGTTGWARRA